MTVGEGNKALGRPLARGDTAQERSGPTLARAGGRDTAQAPPWAMNLPALRRLRGACATPGRWLWARSALMVAAGGLAASEPSLAMNLVAVRRLWDTGATATRRLLTRSAVAAAALGLVLSACGPATPIPTPPTIAAAPTNPAPEATHSAVSTNPGAASKPAPAAPAPAISAPSQPTQGGRFTLGQIADAKTLNPVLVADPYSDVVTSRMYASLLAVDPNTAEVVPQLAESFDFSSDGKTLTFQLRDGLKFSDGSPLTGDDFKFTVMATLRSKKTTHRNTVEQIVGARDYIDGTATDLSGVTVDGNTITVSLASSFCPALTQIGTLEIIPKSVFGQYLDPNDASKNLDDAPENTAPPVASGAFAFKEWVPNDHITLVRNDNYFHRSNIDEWVARPYANQDALTTALKSGEIDMTRIDPKDLADVESAGTTQVVKYLDPAYTYIAWNQLRGGKEFLQDRAVRQALAYGLNVDQVVDKALSGEGVRMIGHIPPVSWAYDPSALNPYAYDPAGARHLLENDGWTQGDDGVYERGGTKLAFTLLTNSGNAMRETLIQSAADQYKQIGVSVETKTESFDALVDRINTSKDPVYGAQGGHDFDAVVIGWSLNADPDMYSVFDSNSTHQSENNFVMFRNPDLDKAIEDSRTHCAPGDRKAALNAANQILNQEQPYNFGFAQNYLLGVSKRLQNVAPGPFARAGQAKPETWWLQ